MKKLIQLAATLGLIATISGQLPRILMEVRVAQLKLLKESQASKWGTPVLYTKQKSR